MRQLAVISGIVFFGGISTVMAAPYPPGSWTGELLWGVLAASALLTVLALEADFG